MMAARLGAHRLNPSKSRLGKGGGTCELQPATARIALRPVDLRKRAQTSAATQDPSVHGGTHTAVVTASWRPSSQGKRQQIDALRWLAVGGWAGH